MKIKSEWSPWIFPPPGNASARLADALADDIVKGKLAGNARLPAHRDLADRLGVSTGTVTKTYGVLERRGLVCTVKGSGTFVAPMHHESHGFIDLARNLPPAAMTESRFRKTLQAVSKRSDTLFLNQYPPAAGHAGPRRQMAHWFAGLGMEADPSRLLLTNGALQALSVALAVTCAPGGTLFTERHAFPGALTLARSLGLRITGLEMDQQGIQPAALEQALYLRDRQRPAALYITPTRQNPTATTMPDERRREIVRLCQAADIAIIEDDVYATAPRQTTPLAMLAPERTFYLNSLSKVMNPALRAGALVTPASAFNRAERHLAAASLMLPSLSCAIMEQWIADGTAQTVMAFILHESRRRTDIARAILGEHAVAADYEGYHLWLPMQKPRAQAICDAARLAGIHLTPPERVLADPDDDSAGLRICLGAVPLDKLRLGLSAVNALLRLPRADDGGRLT